MTVDVAAILNKILASSTEDLADEVVLPKGTWHFTIKDIKPQEGRILIVLTPLEPCDDCDPDAIEEWKAEAEADPAVFHSLRGETERALSGFATAIGVKPGKLVGTKVAALVRHVPNKIPGGRPWLRFQDFRRVA
jgi:hypothetical protein